MLPPEEIAFAAIRVAVEILEKDPPPALRSTSFDVNHDDVMLACREMFEHYKFPSVAQEQLGGNGGGNGNGGGGNGGNGGLVGKRQQFLAQHRHEVSAFLLACRI